MSERVQKPIAISLGGWLELGLCLKFALNLKMDDRSGEVKREAEMGTHG